MRSHYVLDAWEPDILLGLDAHENQPSIGFNRLVNERISKVNSSPLVHNEDSPICTIAPTRSGKGRCVVIPNLLRYSGSCIVLDIKGELACVTARRRREMGQEVYIIDPTRTLSRYGIDSSHINPLDSLKLPGSDFETDTASITNMLCLDHKGSKEPFWDLNGSALLQAVLTLAATDPDPEKQTLGQAAEILTADDVVYSLAVKLDTLGLKMNRMAHRILAQILQMPDITRGGVIATAQAYLKPLMTSSILSCLSSSSFPLQRIIDGDPITVYLVMPPYRLSALSGLVRLIIGTFLNAIMSRKERPSIPTYVVLDEVAQLGKFSALETLITLCGGYGVRTHMFWQDTAQIRSAYPDSWATILNNCGIVQWFGGGSTESFADSFFQSKKSNWQSGAEISQWISVRGRSTLQCGKLDYLRDAPDEIYDPNPIFRPARSGTLL